MSTHNTFKVNFNVLLVLKGLYSGHIRLMKGHACKLIPESQNKQI